MPFLSPTSRNHSLDLILSLTTKTPELPLSRLSDASTQWNEQQVINLYSNLQYKLTNIQQMKLIV